MNPPENNDSLARTLADWRVVPPRDPHFRRNTWARIISRQKGNDSWWNYARGHRALIVGVTAVAVIFGGWVGREQARTRADLDRALLAESYVRSLDARTMRLP